MLDLGFGRCKLQVQVPEKGTITDARQLIGKNVVTSFTGLAEKFFAQLEAEAEEDAGDKTKDTSSRRKLKTKIKYVGGSVEAACALGVADGIVDLVGTYLHSTLFFTDSPIMFRADLVVRIRRNHESSRSQSHRHRRRKYRGAGQIEKHHQQRSRRVDRLSNQGRDQYVSPFQTNP